MCLQKDLLTGWLQKYAVLASGAHKHHSAAYYNWPRWKFAGAIATYVTPIECDLVLAIAAWWAKVVVQARAHLWW
jgi:hypothetical protein